MGRGKLNMELIEKEKARMITYQKRKRGLKKKAQEFATLCGVPTCMIVYGPRVNNRPVDVEVWPQDPEEFMAVVDLYRNKAFSSVRGVKSHNLQDFFTERKRKVDEKIAKARRAYYESKFSSEWDDLNKFSLDQLKEIVALFDNNIEFATRKLIIMKQQHQNLNEDNKPEIFPNNNNNRQFFNRQQHQQQPLASVNMEQQLVSYGYPYDHDQHHQILHHHHQMVPFEFNPIDNPMMMVMRNGCCGGDQIQMASASFPYSHPMQQYARFLDPVAGMTDNRLMMNNNPKAAGCLYGSAVQPLMQPYNDYQQYSLHPRFNSSSQMNGHGSHQFNEFFRNMNEFRHESDRENLL